MPHPERHMVPYQHPFWTRQGLTDEPDGMKIFERAVAACR
jgi:phosphoribosylformylglycinamidine synthase